ncbi:transposase [Mesorhizobium sp. M0045]|uniref:transposase n=1 Tax=Mesorhizobium sp. M0045 TaxID=2956857 RepID=UPI00333DB480
MIDSSEADDLRPKRQQLLSFLLRHSRIRETGCYRTLAHRRWLARQSFEHTAQHRKLRKFRAGIEASISCLKRAYGLARCTWSGLNHFKAYVWSSVVAYNLALFTRLRPG